jgi:hypothetical protein
MMQARSFNGGKWISPQHHSFANPLQCSNFLVEQRGLSTSRPMRSGLQFPVEPQFRNVIVDSIIAVLTIFRLTLGAIPPTTLLNSVC